MPADILVEVEGQRFAWAITYTLFGVFSFRELVLPVNEHVRFNVAVSENWPAVLYSLWIPAFRIEIDAVPAWERALCSLPCLFSVATFC